MSRKEQVRQRLKELRVEFQAGQKMLEDIEKKRDRLRESMLRIAGAIQVLEELEGEGGGVGSTAGKAPDDGGGR